MTVVRGNVAAAEIRTKQNNDNKIITFAEFDVRIPLIMTIFVSDHFELGDNSLNFQILDNTKLQVELPKKEWILILVH